MHKILLSSAGFQNPRVGDKFLELINKPVEQIKIIFVPTAADNDPDALSFVDASRKELTDLGIKNENIKELRLDHVIAFDEVKGFDAIYVCGGNTFYLLAKFRLYKFNEVIKKFVANGGLYFGVSAGSIIACPEISIALPFDPNDIGLQDFTGLNMFNKIITPHYTNEEKDIIDKFEKNYQYEVIRLTDEQAVWLKNDEIEIIK